MGSHFSLEKPFPEAWEDIFRLKNHFPNRGMSVFLFGRSANSSGGGRPLSFGFDMFILLSPIAHYSVDDSLEKRQ